MVSGVVGLILVKAAAVFVGAAGSSLSLADSARVALLIAGGGEFAFVVFKLAEDLEVLPVEVAKVLTAIVIISMALTPLLAEAAEAAGSLLETPQAEAAAAAAAAAAVAGRGEGEGEGKSEGRSADTGSVAADALVVCGYGEVGQAVCEAIAVGAPTAQFVVFDLNPVRVALGQQLGAPIVYGDGSSPSLLRSAGITAPGAIVVTYAGAERCFAATQKLKSAFPASPLYTRARLKSELAELYRAGADQVITETTETAAGLAAFALQAPETAVTLRDTLQRRQQRAAQGVQGGVAEIRAEILGGMAGGGWEQLLEQSGATEEEVGSKQVSR